jgi:hypothetical protein
MSVIVRRFDGEDLVIPAAELARVGIKPGQFVAIRPMQPVRLIQPRVETSASRARRRDLDALWDYTSIGEEIDAECAHEALWEQWSKEAG